MTPDPLALVLPDADDRRAWRRTHTSIACDTAATVTHYVHGPTGRTLRLDQLGRVYGQDAAGLVRLFGTGGRLALVIALNAVFDGIPDRPVTVRLPALTA